MAADALGVMLLVAVSRPRREVETHREVVAARASLVRNHVVVQNDHPAAENPAARPVGATGGAGYPELRPGPEILGGLRGETRSDRLEPHKRTTWEQTAREQTAREQIASEQTASEQTAL